MPLSVALSIESLTLALPDIGPGNFPASFTHHDTDNHHFVVVSCNPDDSGGKIYKASDEAFINDPDEVTRLILSNEVILEATIGQGRRYQRPLRTRLGLGQLTLTHYSK